MIDQFTMLRQFSNMSFLSAAIETLRFNFAGLAASIGLSTTALATLLGVAAGIGLVVVGIQKWKQAQEENRKAAEEDAQSFLDEKQKLEEYVTQVQTLRQKLAEGSLTEAEAYQTKAQLLEIQNQLVDTYGAEAAGLDLVTGAYEDQIAMIRNLSREKAETFLTDNLDEIAKATEEIEKQRKIMVNGLAYDEDFKS